MFRLAVIILVRLSDQTLGTVGQSTLSLKEVLMWYLLKETPAGMSASASYQGRRVHFSLPHHRMWNSPYEPWSISHDFLHWERELGEVINGNITTQAYKNGLYGHSTPDPLELSQAFLMALISYYGPFHAPLSISEAAAMGRLLVPGQWIYLTQIKILSGKVSLGWEEGKWFSLLCGLELILKAAGRTKNTLNKRWGHQRVCL